MNITQSKRAVEIVIKADYTPMLWGPPGIGKTTMIKQLAKQHEVEYQALTTNLLMLDHLTGIPFNDQGNMVFSRPANLPGTGQGFLLLDEISDGMQSIQKMLYSLILEKQCNGHKLSDQWHVIAAGNRPQDGCGSNMLPAALISRLIHIGVNCGVPDFTSYLPETADVDPDQWINDFALPNKLNPFIIAFIKSFPHRLYYYQAIPRTYEMLSNILSKYSYPDSILHEIIAGTIGPETGNEFFGFLKMAQSIPSIDAIISDPVNGSIPVDIGVLHALTTALVYKAERSNFNNIITYARRLPAEMQIYLLISAISKDDKLASCPDYIQWHNDNKDILN